MAMLGGGNNRQVAKAGSVLLPIVADGERPVSPNVKLYLAKVGLYMTAATVKPQSTVIFVCCR